MPYLDDITELWNSVKESFSDTLTRETINLWFGNIRLEDYDSDTGKLTMSCQKAWSFYAVRIVQVFCHPVFPVNLDGSIGLAIAWIGQGPIFDIRIRACLYRHQGFRGTAR